MGTTSWLAVRLPRLVLTIAAVFVALFAIMPWVHIDEPNSTNLYGSHVDVTVGFGDGRLVALIGVAIVLLRVSLAWLRSWQTAVFTVIIALALAATAITARAAFRDWGGDVTLWLYGDIALSVLVAVCGGLVLSARMRGQERELDEEEDEERAEVTETWA